MWKFYGMFNEFVFILLNVVFLPCVVSKAVGDYEELNGTLLHMNLYLCNQHFRYLSAMDQHDNERLSQWNAKLTANCFR